MSLQVTESIHELMGGSGGAAAGRSLQTAQAKVEEVFNDMDANRDGLISLEEFIHYCSTREDVKRSLMVKETVSIPEGFIHSIIWSFPLSRCCHETGTMKPLHPYRRKRSKK